MCAYNSIQNFYLGKTSAYLTFILKKNKRTFFCTYYQVLIKKQAIVTVKLLDHNGKIINNVRYTDDMVLLYFCVSSFEPLMNQLNEKTKYMFITNGKNKT